MPIPTARPARRALAAGALAAAVVLAAACGDDAALPTDPGALAARDGAPGAAGDTAGAPAPATYAVAGRVVAPRRLTNQRDSLAYEPVAGAAVTVYAWTPADSAAGAGAARRPVATLATDAAGRFVTARLPDGNYVVRAAPPAGLARRPGESFVTLRGGRALPASVDVRLLE